MTDKAVQDVQEEHTAEWMAVPGVVGTAVGEQDGAPCIRVLVARKTDAVAGRIPSEAGGYPVVIEETGHIRPLD